MNHLIIPFEAPLPDLAVTGIPPNPPPQILLNVVDYQGNYIVDADGSYLIALVPVLP